jgi:putative membrane protein
MSQTKTSLLICMLIATALALVLSGWQPYDRLTWLMEVLPVLIAVPILWSTYAKFPLTTLLYWCIFFHGLILIMGGTYTYARVPVGFVVQDWFDLARNPYDKFGHFFQGFAPALIAREILIRNQLVNGRKILVFIVMCIVLAISATYELIEWSAALVMGQGADEFLGTQGDEWDTQSDMFMALIGSIFALVFFARLQDSQLRRLPL